MEEKKTTIKVSHLFTPILGSRDIINKLGQFVINAPTERVDLDFQKLQFISRSAAHELLKLKEELFYRKRNKKEVAFINTNEDVAQMLKIVAANRALPKREIHELKIESINIASLTS